MKTAVRIAESCPLMTRNTRIDEASGVIRGVRVCGLKSKNKRTYPISTLREAVPIYEGLFVYFNPHPPKANAQRDPDRKVGWLKNVHVKEDGMYADLQLDPNKSYSRSVLWAAQHNPRMYSLSHDIHGDLSSDAPGGYRTVNRISSARAVDLVDIGGVNESLFESLNMSQEKTTLRRLIEGCTRMSEDTKNRLLEDDGAVLDAEIPMPPDTDGDGDVDWKDHITNAIAALVKSDSEEDHAKAMQILKMLKPGGGPAPKDGDDDGKVMEGDATLRQENTRLTEEVAALKLKDWVRQECDRLGVPATAKMVDRLAKMRDKGDITAHLQEDFKPAGKQRAPGPRSGGPVDPPRGGSEAKELSREDSKKLLLGKS